MDVTMSLPVVKWPVHIEVRLSETGFTQRFDTIRDQVQQFIQQEEEQIYIPSTLDAWRQSSFLKDSVELITATDSSYPTNVVPIGDAQLEIHVYRVSTCDTFEDMANGASNDGPEEVMAATVCELPNKSWEGLWDTLIYTEDIKSKLLNYIYTTLIFSDAEIDFNVISWNRVLLLHGPPGTGKTSLARALAQKLSIRLAHRYSSAKLLEINSHSLFSKWFSESGKLVQRLFASVTEMVDDDDCFVVVLIDEVESLTAARAGAMSGTEPSDALRVVNALLTQLDKLKHRKNVLIVSTSNLTKAIDNAFIDRADIVQYVGLPPPEAIYEILRSCLIELMHKGIVQQVDVPKAKHARHIANLLVPETNGDATKSNVREVTNAVGLRLLRLAEASVGMSGRSLRRLPVLAHARYIGAGMGPTPVQTTKPNDVSRKKTKKKPDSHVSYRPLAAASIDMWLDGMEKVVAENTLARQEVSHV